MATYALDDGGLRVTLAGTNLSGVPLLTAPAPPYLTWIAIWSTAGASRSRPQPGCAPIRGCCRPAGNRWAGTEFDFRNRVCSGTPSSTPPSPTWPAIPMVSPGLVGAPDGRRLVLWSDRACPWLVLFTGDPMRSAERRRGLAVER